MEPQRERMRKTRHLESLTAPHQLGHLEHGYKDARRDGSVSGLLLYARTDAVEQPDVDVVIQGNRIGARTLDLNRALGVCQCSARRHSRMA